MIADPNQATLMSWRGALYLAPFSWWASVQIGFVMPSVNRMFKHSCPGFRVTMAVNIYQMATWSGVVQAGSILFAMIGATGALTLSAYFPRVGVLERLGAYSFSVYLFHPFFVAPIRMALGMVQVTTLGLVFTGCLIAGIVGPGIAGVLCKAESLGQDGTAGPGR